MQFNLKKYKTLRGRIEVLELINKKRTEAVIYKDDSPAFFVDCYDLQTEANVLMNDLVLCEKRSMKAVIEHIAKKNKVNLLIKEAPMFSKEIASEIVELDLPPLPEEWLS